MNELRSAEAFLNLLDLCRHCSLGVEEPGEGGWGTEADLKL